MGVFHLLPSLALTLSRLSRRRHCAPREPYVYASPQRDGVELMLLGLAGD
jgi:hypothetical protein